MNDLCFDVEGEYIGSCSDDGSVVINGLFTEERMKFEYHRPMKAIAVDPGYANKSSRRFVTGGLAGQLYFNVKKWIGYRDQVSLKFSELTTLALYLKDGCIFELLIHTFVFLISRFCTLVKVQFML